MSQKPHMSEKIPKKNAETPLGIAFQREKVICRVIAAWAVFAAVILLSGGGKYADLSFAQDVSLGKMILMNVGFFAVFSVIAYFLPKFESDTWFLMLGATVCVFTWLKTYSGNKEKYLVVLAIIVAYSLFVQYFVTRNQALFALWQPGKNATLVAACVLGVICAVVISVITCLRYLTFSTPNFDFGLFVNMFHNMRETGLPNVTCERDMLLSHFAVHISPIYYLLLPFYYIFPSPLTLQIGQAVVLASGVIPVWLLARHFKLSGKMQILVTAIYALYPAVSAGCFYDIHENCFLAPLLLWLFYFYEKENYLGMYIAAFGVLMVKEDAAMYVIMFALYVMLTKHEKKGKWLHGAALALGAIAYFCLALYLLATFGDGVMVNRFNNLIYNGEDGLLGAIKTALQNPGFLLTQLFTTSGNNWDKIIYILQMFLPLGLMPFVTRKPSRWLLMAPMLMNLLTYYQYQYNLTFQYNFGVSAFLIYALLANISELKAPARKTLVTIGAVACCCFYIATVLPQWDSNIARWENGKDTYTQMEEILDTLPEDASLSVSSMLLAHVADRDVVYQAKYNTPGYQQLYHDDKPDVDFVVLDARYMDGENEKLRDAYMEKHGYTIYADYPGMILILQSPEMAAAASSAD